MHIISIVPFRVTYTPKYCINYPKCRGIERADSDNLLNIWKVTGSVRYTRKKLKYLINTHGDVLKVEKHTGRLVLENTVHYEGSEYEFFIVYHYAEAEDFDCECEHTILTQIFHPASCSYLCLDDRGYCLKKAKSERLPLPGHRRPGQRINYKKKDTSWFFTLESMHHVFQNVHVDEKDFDGDDTNPCLGQRKRCLHPVQIYKMDVVNKEEAEKKVKTDVGVFSHICWDLQKVNFQKRCHQ